MTKTVIRYAGGKSRAIKHITPYVEQYDSIVSPFIGGGSLEVHWASMGKKVKGFDVFDILVDFWQTLLTRPDDLAAELKKIEPNDEVYRKIKEDLICTPQVQQMIGDWGGKGYYKRTPVPMSKLKLSAYYYFNHNTSYGPGFLGWMSKIYMDKKKWNSMAEKVEKFSCPNLQVDLASFEQVIPAYNTEPLYLDPPYYLESEEGNKMHSGVYPMKNFAVHHNSFPHEKLRDLLHSHNGPFVLSYNDCPTIREWYGDFDLYYPKWHYSMGQGELRLGDNRKALQGGIQNIDKLEQKMRGFLGGGGNSSWAAKIAREVRNEAKIVRDSGGTMFEDVIRNSEKVSNLFRAVPGLNKYIPALSGLNEKDSHEILIVKK